MLARRAHIDFETGSPEPMGKGNSVGVYRYAENPHTRVWGFRWRLGNEGEVHEWRPGYPDPVELLDHVRAGGVVVAHNAAFERIIWNWLVCMRLCPHWPTLTPEHQDCTMARASAAALPPSLEKLAEVLGLQNQKDMDGSRAMKRMSKPRKAKKGGGYEWWHESEPGLYEENMDYCGKDVLAETEADLMLPPLSEEERACWVLDQYINDRGVQLDVSMVDGAAAIVEIAKKRADREIRSLTNGAVPKVTSVKDIVAWLQGRGFLCESLRKEDFEDLIFQASILGDKEAAKVIALRKAASKTSVAKFKKMKSMVNADGRLRGNLRWHGARTGRWAGSGAQLQNFPRCDHENEYEVQVLDWLREKMSDGTPPDEVVHALEVMHGSPLVWISKSLRGAIRSAEGNVLFGGDFSNVEGRKNAWLAGETWKLQAFEDYDNGTGPDLYKLAYSRSFGADIEDITKEQRQVGKVQELALGYQGSVNAYISMAANYGVTPYDISPVVEQATDAEKWDRTAAQYAKARDKAGLQEREWTAIKVLVGNWRSAHPAIVSSWWAYEEAALAAVQRPGVIVPVQSKYRGFIPVSFMSDGGFLYCRLPSGRVLSYASPFVETSTETAYRKDGTRYNRTVSKVAFWGVDSRTRAWKKLYLYGGLICENVTQASSRDLMVYSMFNLERAGYPIVLTVHDEIVSELAKGVGDENQFKEIMSMKPSWAEGMPLSVSAWEDERYVK